MLAGDIICLQEVGEDYMSLLSEDLGKRGYTGQFCQKTLGTKEGLATFYNNTVFDCIAVEKISYNEMLADALEEEGIDCCGDAGYDRDHVFLVMKMKHLKTDLTVTVGNIHTIWDQFRQPDVTSLQVALALARLVKIADRSPLIIAGDFNSSPAMPAYDLLCNGELTQDHKNKLVEAATCKVNDKCLFDALEKHYTHSTPTLASSYLVVRGKERSLTTYGHHPADFCLDYIWYTQGNLEANSVLDTTLLISRIPNSVFPSDHLSLKSTFSFTD